MKNLVLLMCCLSMHQAVQAQIFNYSNPEQKKHFYNNVTSGRVINNYPDSIRLEFPQQDLLVVIESKRFETTKTAIENLAMNFQEIYKSLSQYETFKKDQSYRVNIAWDKNGFRKTHIEETSRQASLLQKEEQLIQLLPPGIEILVADYNYKTYIYTSDIQKLQDYSQSSSTLVLEKLHESRSFISGRKSTKARFIFKDNALSYHDIKFAQPLDLISLSGSVSAGVFRNKIYPELVGSLGLYFADRSNRVNHRIELSYCAMYFSNLKLDGGYSNSVSSFLTLSYSKNFSKKDSPSWTGIGVGLLVNDSNHFFKGKTARFSIITNPGNGRVSIVPEFYLTDDFKKFELGLKLHYRL